MRKILVASDLLVSSETPAHRVDHNFFSTSVQALTDFLGKAEELCAVPVMMGASFAKLKVNDAIQVAILLTRQPRPVVVCPEKNNPVLTALSDFSAIKLLVEAPIVYDDSLAFVLDEECSLAANGDLALIVGFGNAACDLKLLRTPGVGVSGLVVPPALRQAPGADNAPAFVFFDGADGIFRHIQAGYDHEDMLRDVDAGYDSVEGQSKNSIFIDKLKARFSGDSPPALDLMTAIDEVVEEQSLPLGVAAYAKTLLMR